MSSPAGGSAALEVARALLEEAGITGCRLEAGGPKGEVLLLTLTEADEERLFGSDGGRLRAGLRSAGFRYVATDLLPEPE